MSQDTTTATNRALLSPEERIEMVRMLAGRGMTDRQIADHMGYKSRTMVISLRQAGGIPPANPPSPRQVAAQRLRAGRTRFDLEDTDEL